MNRFELRASSFRPGGSGVRIGRMLAAVVACACLLPSRATAQLQLSGQVEALATFESETRGLNLNFRNDSPFSSMRARVFAQHWVTDRIGVFAEFLYDIESTARINGAYVVINEIGGLPWLGARLGMAPSIMGNFSMRSTYFNTNPVIGVPLVWQHRTTLDGSGLATANDLVRRRAQNIISLPMMYDACWNVQWELLGYAGRFEYSLGATSGSLSNPLQTRTVDGVLYLARFGYEPIDGLSLGASGAIGPYIGGPNRDPGTLATAFPGVPDDYDQRVIGADAEWLVGKFHFFAEAYHGDWEVPLIDERLSAQTAYIDGQWDFLSEWFIGARVGTFLFSDVDYTADDGPATTGWDDDVLRTEVALTHRLAREVHLRADWQRSTFLTGEEEPEDVLAVQVRAVF